MAWRLPLLEVEIDLKQRRVAIHDDLRKVRRHRLAAFLFLLFSLACMALLFRYGGMRRGGALIIAIVILAVLAFRYYRRSNDTAPDLILTPEGLNDRWIGAGVIPWRYVVVYGGTYSGKPAVFLDSRRLMDWISHSMPNDWMSLTSRATTYSEHYKFIVVPTDGPVTMLNTDTGITLTVPPHDVLWLLSHYTTVKGLPEGYTPVHPELRRLPPNALGTRIVDAEFASPERGPGPAHEWPREAQP